MLVSGSLLAIVLSLAIGIIVDSAPVRARVADAAARALGRPVDVGSVSVSVLSGPAIRLGNAAVAEDPAFGRGAFLAVQEINVALRVRPLLSRRIEIAAVSVRSPRLVIVRAADGRVNVATLGSTATESDAPAGVPAALLGSRVDVEDGVVSYVSEGTEGAARTLRLEGLTVAANLGPTLAVEANGHLQPGGVAVRLREGAVHLDEGVALTEAPVQAQLQLEGGEIHELMAALAGDAVGIGGGGAARLAVTGTLRNLQANGALQVSGLRLSREATGCKQPGERTLTFSALTAQTAWRDGRLSGEPATLHLGEGVLSTSLALSFNEPLRLQLKDLDLTGIPLGPVLVDFLCADYAVSGDVDLSGALSLGAPSVAETLSGFGQLHIGPGKVVGPRALGLLGAVVRAGGAVSSLLNADLPWSLFSSPLDFESITASYQIAQGVVRIVDLSYDSGAMKLAASGEYALRSGDLDLDMVIHHGRGVAYASVKGPAASPSVRVRPTTFLRDVDPAKIGEGLHALLDRLR